MVHLTDIIVERTESSKLDWRIQLFRQQAIDGNEQSIVIVKSELKKVVL